MIINYYSLSKKGKRSNNEDYIYPSQETSEAKGLFIVCDGVGGSNNGEIASKISCKTIADYFSWNQTLDPNEKIKEAVLEVERNLDKYVEDYPQSKGMATTLALLYFENKTAFIAHIGDSRVYHIRNGEILFRTQDHSLVNELIMNGYITEQEAKTHPKRNIITRAISGTTNAALVHITGIDEIKDGDYFFLCTDGILESIDEEFMEQHFSKHTLLFENGVSRLLDTIDSVCSKNSNDNYSAIIVSVQD